jgi:hypothetical protein
MLHNFIILHLLIRRGGLVRLGRGLMHRERRAWAFVFVERDIQFMAQFISGDHFCLEGGAHVERTGNYLVADLLGGFEL